MKRIKSAPANIAEMVNRKKHINLHTANNNNDKNNDKKFVYFFPFHKQKKPLIVREKLNIIKNQKNIEKTFNSIMLDYINDKQIMNINDEQSVLASILYYYICEKIFTKNNLREFILFIIQIFLRYIFTHELHNYISNNQYILYDLITFPHQIS